MKPTAGVWSIPQDSLENIVQAAYMGMGVLNVACDPTRPNITTWREETKWESHKPNTCRTQSFDLQTAGGKLCNPFIATNAMAFGVLRASVNKEKLVQTIAGLGIPNVEWNLGHANGNGRLVVLDGHTRLDWMALKAVAQYTKAQAAHDCAMGQGSLDERDWRALQYELEMAVSRTNCYGSWVIELYDLGPLYLFKL